MADGDSTSDEGRSEGRTFSHDEVERIVADRVYAIKGERDQLKRELEEHKSKTRDTDQLERQVEKLTQQRDEARDKARETRERSLNAQMRAEVTAAAVQRGAVDTEDVFRLLPDGAVSVNAESGAIEGVDQAVATLAEAKPHLFSAPARPGPGDGGPRSDHGRTEPRQPVSMNDLLRGATGRST